MKLNILKGNLSEYCSLVNDDGIESIEITVKKEKEFKNIICDLKKVSRKYNREASINIENLIQVTFFNENDEEVIPEYHRTVEILATSEDKIKFMSESKYDADDNFFIFFDIK